MASGSRRYSRGVFVVSSARGSADGDGRRASFDKLRMRSLLRATQIAPHPGLVEGRRLLMPRSSLLHPLRVAAAGAVAVLRVRVRRMAVAMIMIVTMIVVVIMRVIIIVMVVMAVMDMIGVRADALDVMMMPCPGQADLGFEADDLLAVFAELAVHVG